MLYMVGTLHDCVWLVKIKKKYVETTWLFDLYEIIYECCH